MKKHVEDAFSELKSRELSLKDKQDMWAKLEQQIDATPVDMRKHQKKSQRWKHIMPTIASASAAVIVAVIMLGSVMSATHKQTNRTTATRTSNNVAPVKTSKHPKPTVTLPSVHYANAVTSWHGFGVGPYPSEKTTFEITGKGNTPIPLEKSFTTSVLNNPKTKTDSLSSSRSKAGFLVHEPANIVGWTRTKSVGAQLPIRQLVNGKMTGYTYSPVHYYDFYQNQKGQKIAVTQTTNTVLSSQFKQLASKNPPAWMKQSTPAIHYHHGAHVLSGFHGDLVILYQDKTDTMKELTVYHPEKDGSLLILTVDGTERPNVLAYFAQTYLSAPTK